ncbi:energy transducer TonB [Colwellia psychrerythraea]|jgi:TonB family protein|uniref:Putative lipoprotein n=1 Tax=Colwellia psychrerythraea (strain 34H / ATCC BAA-681) TaxID=167879 RepID=Q47ZE8_COLP3|nr:energy transducer TonB [Colwellia psychrerythraea]AAZ27835.1 putative lipoprotein [Colwellia psychrerythraea 34H]
MKHLALSLFFSSVLIGCQSQYLIQPAIEIKEPELSKYWIAKDGGISFKASSGKLPSENGTVFINYLIDSNGKVFNLKVVNSTPSDAWNKIALKLLKRTTYINTETNLIKAPVIVTTKVVFDIY